MAEPEAEGILVHAYVTYYTEQANVQIRLHDVVFMTRQNDVYEAAQ